MQPHVDEMSWGIEIADQQLSTIAYAILTTKILETPVEAFVIEFKQILDSAILTSL